MLYRTIGKTGVKASILGYGCMRFPVTGGDQRNVDRDKSFALLRRAHELGVNYFDTGYMYHGGNSEAVLGEAVHDFRNEIIITTKMPPGEIKEPDDMERILETQLKRLNTSYLDFYFLHAMRRKSWDDLKQMNVLKFLEKARSDGRIRHIGFSFHDTYDVLTDILDSFDWELVQLQHNYVQLDFQAGLKGLKEVERRGIGISIMEPMHGGDLAREIPVQMPIWEASEHKRTPVGWALRYLWSQPGISLVLSGMSSLEQLEENVALASEPSMCTPLTASEEKTLKDAADAVNAQSSIPCTGCSYCMPCPFGVDIPLNFHVLNNAMVFNNMQEARERYKRFSSRGKGAGQCHNCGACIPKCPQQIKIPDMLSEVRDKLEQ